LELGYHIGRFHRDDQTLNYALRLAHEDLEAYRSDEINTNVMVEREMSDDLTLSAGLGLRVSRAEQLDETDEYTLMYVPFRAELDKSNDKLNPTHGYRLTFEFQPYFDFVNLDSAFVQADAEFRHYLSLDKQSKWVLATRTHVGTLAGESLNGIPPSLRYYAGGGGSIRGFEYKTVGPLVGNDPVGGRSLFEASVEIRRRLSETLGVVAFVDAGTAFEESWPSFGEQMRYAVGVGARYFTSVGPLRFDIAVPVNKREDIDDLFEFYLSIGQSF
jgi:translocation and assembly module TamA